MARLTDVSGGLVVGAVLGAAGAWLTVSETSFTPPPSPVEPPACELSTDALEMACLPYMRQTATTLDEAQTRVSALEIRVREKEAEVRQLEELVRERSAGAAEVASRLEEARVQLEELEARLDQAVAEKNQLVTDLKHTRDELAGTLIKLAMSEARVVEEREATLEQRWVAFVASSQLQVCEGKAGQAACQDLVAAVLAPHRARYKDCVRSGGAIPDLKRGERRSEISDQAAWFEDYDRSLRDWYVLFCDPELPEGGGDRVTR